MKKYCENCGYASYDGACTNCHEEIYIEQQYEELGIETPKSISEKTGKCRDEIRKGNHES